MSEEHLEREFDRFDFVRWSILCRAMMIRVVRGEFEGAHQGLRTFCKQPFRELATIHSHVGAVLDIRVANALEAAGYDTLDSLRFASDSDLCLVPNVGERAVGSIRETIEKVFAGEVFETYGVDEDMIDEQFVVLDWQRKTAKEEPAVTDEQKLADAVALVVANPDKVAASIDAQIANHEVEVDRRKREIKRLKLLRSNLVGKPKSGKPAESRSNCNWDAIVAKVQEYVKRNGPSKAAAISEGTKYSRIMVGKAVARSLTLKKNAQGEVCLA